MRISILFIAILLCSKGFCQSAPTAQPYAMIKIDKISNFIDSIKNKLLKDTIKFNRQDLVKTNNGIVNTKSYAPLFFVNILLKYKLDIVPGNEVLNFSNEILNANKIESIYFIEATQSIKTFGTNGLNGVIMIDMKKDAPINYLVAGLKMNNKKGNNFEAQ